VDRAVEGLKGIQPTYLKDSELFWKDLDIVGYGMSGDYRTWFGRCDGRKRAVVSPINAYSSYGDINKNDISHVTSYVGRGDFNSPNKIVFKSFQGGFRPGMSGGGSFLKDQYVAIPSRYCYRYHSWLNKSHNFFSKIFKCIAAAGFPALFTRGFIDQMEEHLILANLEDWIESLKKRKND
jgi:hypothetical protein